MDIVTLDAVEGNALSPEEKEPLPVAADVTTSVAMIFEEDRKPDAANIVESVSSEVSSTPPEVPDGLLDTFVASAPLGSMWIPDLRYPTVALVRHSSRMAGRPRPKYRV